jgi:hypothetical protein
LQLVTPYPAAARIVAGCGVVRALAEKSCALGFLERDERASLLETMSLLPEAQAHGALSVLLGVTGGPAEADLRRHLRRPLDFPVSCARMRQRHAAAASAAGCTCVFHGLWGGAYPAPILHALRPTDIPALRKRMEESRQRSRRPARPEPVEPVAERPIARPPRGDGRDAERAVRVPSSGAPQPRAAEGDLGARVEALYRKLVNLRKAADEAAASALRTEAALAKAFEEAGVERFRVAEGWLTRLPGDRPRFVIDLG